jgi:hypothetical protein
MTYDEGLAERLRDQFVGQLDVEERRMFGGLCFMVSRHMCCGIVGDVLMARVGPEQYPSSLQEEFAREMDFTGKPLKGLVYIDPEGFETEDQLSIWVNRCTSFVETLPPK